MADAGNSVPPLRKPQVSRQYETGPVFFPRGASWLSTLFDELLTFPNCEKGDQVDSTSQALEWLQHRFASEFLADGEVRERPRWSGGDR